MGISRYEQETIVSFNAEEDRAEVYTCEPVTMRKLHKLLDEKTSEFILKEITSDSMTVTCPKRCITFKSGKKRELTEEQKQAFRERMQKVRKEN